MQQITLRMGVLLQICWNFQNTFSWEHLWMSASVKTINYPISGQCSTLFQCFLVFCNIKLLYACVRTSVLSMYTNKQFEEFNKNTLLMSQWLIMSQKNFCYLITMLTETSLQKNWQFAASLREGFFCKHPRRRRT